MIPKISGVQSYLENHEFEVREFSKLSTRLNLVTQDCIIKIALDQKGYDDNLKEFELSSTMKPFAIQVYETNGFVSVCELLTPIA